MEPRGRDSVMSITETYAERQRREAREAREFWGARRSDGSYERVEHVEHEDGLREQFVFRCHRVSGEAMRNERRHGIDVGTQPGWRVTRDTPDGAKVVTHLGGGSYCVTLEDAQRRVRVFLRDVVRNRAARIERERKLADARALLADLAEDGPRAAERILAARRARLAEAERDLEAAVKRLQAAREAVERITEAQRLVAEADAQRG